MRGVRWVAKPRTVATLILALGLGIGLGPAWIPVAGAQDPESESGNGDWICVPGENGRWRCGHPGDPLEPESLPPLGGAVELPVAVPDSGPFQSAPASTS